MQAAQQLFARCGVQGEILHKQRPSGVLYEFNIRAPEQVARVHASAINVVTTLCAIVTMPFMVLLFSCI